MRDHRSTAERHAARFRPAPSGVRPVARVLLTSRRGAPAAAVGRGPDLHLHLQVATTLLGPRLETHLHRPGQPGRDRASTPAVAAPRHPAVRAGVVAAGAVRPGAAVRGVAAPHLARAVVHPRSTPVRSDAVVPRVERVVTRTSAAGRAEPGATHPAPTPAWAAAPAPAAPAARPGPAELESITAHVLTAIDRRLIAHGERLGRG